MKTGRKPEIFDFHFHAYGISRRGEDHSPLIRRLIRSGRVAGILCCSDLYCEHRDFERRNRSLLDLSCELGPAKLPIAATIHPDAKASWRKSAAGWLGRHPNIRALKLKPEMRKTPIEPRYIDSVFEFANEMDLIVVSHTQPEREYSAINFIGSLKKMPSTKLVLYHASLNEEAAYLAAIFPNVHVEPSWLGFTPNLFSMMENLGGYSKMLAGTDGPGWFKSFKGDPYADLVTKAAGLMRTGNKESLELFCAGNARRLLGI